MGVLLDPFWGVVGASWSTLSVYGVIFERSSAVSGLYWAVVDVNCPKSATLAQNVAREGGGGEGGGVIV